MSSATSNPSLSLSLSLSPTLSSSTDPMWHEKNLPASLNKASSASIVSLSMRDSGIERAWVAISDHNKARAKSVHLAIGMFVTLPLLEPLNPTGDFISDIPGVCNPTGGTKDTSILISFSSFSSSSSSPLFFSLSSITSPTISSSALISLAAISLLSV